MSIEKLLTVYWSQVTLLLVAIGYFLKRIFDLKNKKVEIRYTLFQQKKIEAITKFVDRYNKAEAMWNAFSIHHVIDRRLTADDLDKIIMPTMFDISISISELAIYLKEHERKPFETISESLWGINKVVSEIHFKYIRGDSTEVSNEFHFVKMKCQKICRDLLDVIGEVTRRTYNS